MKNKEQKKHHESTIGKIIYGFLLFAPLFAILTTCMYVIFNKNAKDSYTGDYKFTKQVEITANDKFNDGSYYSLTEKSNGNTNIIFGTELTNLNIEEIDFNIRYYIDVRRHFSDPRIEYFFPDYITIEDYSFNLGQYTQTNSLKITISNIEINVNGNNIQPNTYIKKTYTNDEEQISFDYYVYKSSNFNRNLSYTYVNNEKMYFQQNATGNRIPINNLAITNYATGYARQIIIDRTLSSIFYASCNKVEESTLFNWSKNTAIYTAIQNTTNTIGMTNTFIPMLLTYWLLTSVLYFLYDIILMILNIFHRKIHEVEESI